MRIPSDADFGSRLRSAAVAARVGLWLGVCFGICFVTGLISHYAQNADHPVPFPASPVWGYRVTQGLHVATGTAAVPLLLVKLWAVYPRLFLRPARGLRRLVLDALERGSIGVLVASAIFQLASGLANSAQWYPWAFSFRSTHYALAWVAIGALLVHVAVKLPIIRGALRADVEATTYDRPSAVEAGVLSRRGLLRTTWLAAGVAVLATAGSTVPLLRRVSVLGVRSGDGPMGIPVNKAASTAGTRRGRHAPARGTGSPSTTRAPCGALVAWLSARLQRPSPSASPGSTRSTPCQAWRTAALASFHARREVPLAFSQPRSRSDSRASSKSRLAWLLRACRP